jgi:hypothetical protein
MRQGHPWFRSLAIAALMLPASGTWAAGATTLTVHNLTGRMLAVSRIRHLTANGIVHCEGITIQALDPDLAPFGPPMGDKDLEPGLPPALPCVPVGPRPDFHPIGDEPPPDPEGSGPAPLPAFLVQPM